LLSVKKRTADLLVKNKSAADFGIGDTSVADPGSGMGKKIKIRIRDEHPGS
jgi:hypothetical protein